MRVFVAFALLLLSGCVATDSPEALTSYRQTCTQMGAVTQEQMFQCIQNQYTAANAEEMHRREAAGAWGDALLARNQTVRVAPSTTTCRPSGNQVICNTF
jgi:hypothetical protein